MVGGLGVEGRGGGREPGGVGPGGKGWMAEWMIRAGGGRGEWRAGVGGGGVGGAEGRRVGGVEVRCDRSVWRFVVLRYEGLTLMVLSGLNRSCIKTGTTGYADEDLFVTPRLFHCLRKSSRRLEHFFRLRVQCSHRRSRIGLAKPTGMGNRDCRARDCRGLVGGLSGCAHLCDLPHTYVHGVGGTGTFLTPVCMAWVGQGAAVAPVAPV